MRTVFKTGEKGSLYQSVLNSEDIHFDIEHIDLRDVQGIDNADTWMESFESKPFDLSSAPLIRVSLCRTADSTWLLTYVMHHIISDGWSMGILLKEILAIYQAQVDGVIYDPQPLPSNIKIMLFGSRHN